MECSETYPRLRPKMMGIAALNPSYALRDFLLYHLVGLREQRLRHRQAKRIGNLAVDDQFEGCGLLDRQVRRLLPFENSSGVISDHAVDGGKAAAITDQTPKGNKFALQVTWRNPVAP